MLVAEEARGLVVSLADVPDAGAVAELFLDGERVALAALEPGGGSTVPAGTVVRYEFVPHEYTDIYWFGTGHNFDTPYGDTSFAQFVAAVDPTRFPAIANAMKASGTWSVPTMLVWENLYSQAETPEQMNEREELQYVSAQARTAYVNQKRNMMQQQQNQGLTPEIAAPLFAASGDVYVFTRPDDGVSSVDFYLDAPPTGTPYRSERSAPFDLVGGLLWQIAFLPMTLI